MSDVVGLRPEAVGKYGSHIDDVADALRKGVISSGDLLVRVFDRGEGILVAINNRTFAALSKANMKPSNLQLMEPSKSELRRLREVGPLGDRLPSTRIVVTPSVQDRHTILQVIDIPID